MRMNALKHGCDAAPENEAAVMRALGEDPQRFAALKEDLMSTYGPGDALWEQQLEDLARLYWRRNRIERMQTGLMRRALEAIEERQRDRGREIAAATFDPCHGAAIDIGVGESTDPVVRLRLLLSLLGVLRQQVRQRVFKPRQHSLMKTYYQGDIGWRSARLGHLVWLFVERAKAQAGQDKQELHEFVSEYFEGGEAAVETHYQELLALLDEEIAYVEEEFKHEVKAQENRDAIERDACLAPAGETWEMLLRQEAALDRSIDRKVRIILTMRKEHAQQQKEAATPPEDEPREREAEELSKLVGLDARSEGLAEETAAEISKSPEKSENVTENKAPAGQARRASGKQLPTRVRDPQREEVTRTIKDSADSSGLAKGDVHGKVTMIRSSE
jgi:hypothetical protein